MELLDQLIHLSQLVQYLFPQLLPELVHHIVHYLDKCDATILSFVSKSHDSIKIGRVRKEEFCKEVASLGHLEVLKWARENGCEWDSGTCAYAAQGGHLEVLKWARENGCDWDSNTCTYAAEGGHLEVLKWAREHGCECNGKYH
jgi:hypothetical protein